MSDVPWARHRRALVLDICHTGRWVECVGVDTDDGEPAWEATGLDDDGEPQGEWWIGTLGPTSPLPGQCPRCYFVDGHEDGCMVAANIARGVPAFWAPWAMWEMPAGRLSCETSLIVIDRACPPRRASGFTDWDHRPGAENGVAVVALSFDGPTLAPWGKE